VQTRANIHLSTKVKTIETTVHQGHEQDPKVTVSTENGNLEFDEVVIAVPLGCLKREQPIILPQIPPRLYRAIQNASYSSLEKVYISFPVDFWSRPGAAETQQGGSTTLPSFTHFLNPQYVPEVQKSWTIELFPLSSTAHFGSLAQPALLFYLYGACATHVTSLVGHLSPTSTEYFEALASFFRPYYSLLPHYDANDAECTPNAVLSTNWQNDELAGRGSYTNFQVGKHAEEVCLDEDIREMRAGMPDRGIWFAGEHTAPFVALGTSTGAYWSGESAAVKVLGANGLLPRQIRGHGHDGHPAADPHAHL
jgi:hypothetical protein